MKLRYLAPLVLIGSTLIGGCKPQIQAPAPDQLFVRANEPVEVTFKLAHDTSAELEFQFTRSDLQIPGQPAVPPEPATFLPIPVSTAKLSLRRTAVIFAFDQAGTWRVRARNQGQGGEWSYWRRFAVVDEGQSPLAASLRLEPEAYQGPCPIAIEATGLIGSAANGRVRYWFQRSDGHKTAPIELDLAMPTTLVAKTSMPTVGLQESSPDTGWLQLVAQSLPEGTQAVSPQVPFEVVCTNAD
jgi:hypothetical protein